MTHPDATPGRPADRPVDAVVIRPATGSRRLAAALARNGIAVRTGPAPTGDPDRTMVITDPAGHLPLAVFDGLAARVGTFRAARLLQAPLDVDAQRKAEEHQLRLTKPPGSLGWLEAVGAQLAGIAAAVPPPPPRPAVVAVFAISTNVCAAAAPPFSPPATTHSVDVDVLPAELWPS